MYYYAYMGSWGCRVTLRYFHQVSFYQTVFTLIRESTNIDINIYRIAV